MERKDIFAEGTCFTPSYPVPYSDDDVALNPPDFSPESLNVGKWVTISESKFWDPEDQPEFLGVFEKILLKGDTVMGGVELQSDCIVATEILTTDDGCYVLGGRRYIPVTYQIKALANVLSPSQVFHLKYTGKEKTSKGRVVKTFDIRVFVKY